MEGEDALHPEASEDGPHGEGGDGTGPAGLPYDNALEVLDSLTSTLIGCESPPARCRPT